jgi:hypothetical protein
MSPASTVVSYYCTHHHRPVLYHIQLTHAFFISFPYSQELITDFLGMPSAYSEQAANANAPLTPYTIIQSMYVFTPLHAVQMLIMGTSRLCTDALIAKQCCYTTRTYF